MPTVSCRPSRLLRFDELTVDVASALRDRAGTLLASLVPYYLGSDAAYMADVGDAPAAVQGWVDSHRRLGEWTAGVAIAFIEAETGPACVVAGPRPGGVLTVAAADVSGPVDPEADPDRVGPVVAASPAIVDTLPAALNGDDDTPLWQQVLDGAARPEAAALIAVTTIPPRGDHAVSPVRRLAVTRWLGNAATGFGMANVALDGFGATRGRPTLDRLEVAGTGVGVAGSVTLAGTAFSAARCGPNLWCLGGVALATGFAASGAADWAMGVAAAGTRRETPDGRDLDALREEIADDDPADALVAAAELAGAEQAAATTADDPELAARVGDVSGPLTALEADLVDAADDGGEG